MDITDLVNPSAALTSYLFPDDGSIPNNAVLPLLVYEAAIVVGPDNPAAACESVFVTNQWSNSWRNGIYSYHHYHSTAHEVLAIACGNVTVQMGGENGVRLEISAGDVLVIPAGVGHKNLGASRDLLVVGAYPKGQHWDLCSRNRSHHLHAIQNIAAVPLPMTDPVFGAQGPLRRMWKA
jgi:uncharacterized protein YjlB